jgi:glycosyltransferase involved in cell wall biosynthesis
MLSGGLRTKGITRESQENMPLITVITVVRNGEKTLEQTILSVINQTYTNIEYIIVDGASTDGTLDIIRTYEDRIDYWISDPDGGIYYAMNKGIELATGEWINFMNSGDGFYDNKTVGLIIQYIIKNDNYAVFYGNTQVYFESGSNIIKPVQMVHNKMNRMDFCHQSSFTKTSILKGRHFDTKYKIASDYDFFRYLYLHNNIFKYIPIIFAKYDAIDGFSVNNPLKRTIEYYKINNFFEQKINYCFFGFIAVYIILLNLFKKIIPKNILRWYRNIKYRPPLTTTF